MRRLYNYNAPNARA